MNSETPESSAVANRSIGLLLIVIIIVSVIGFIVGINQGVPKHDGGVVFTGGRGPMSPDVLPAMSYDDMRQSEGQHGRVYQMHELPRQTRDLFEVVTVDLEARRASLDARSERRAYNGAPPVIPHTVDQIGNDSCLICHGAGFAVDGGVAREVPHPYLANCTQCHAPPAPFPLPSVAPVANSFRGIAAPFEGERAWPGAPPTIPHSTWMRDNCLSCHGPAGWLGMESTHPWRTACLQCHAPSADLDQRPAAAEFLAPLPIAPADRK